MNKFNPKEWFRANEQKEVKSDDVEIGEVLGYGLTIRDLYDLVNLRHYEKRQHYSTRYEMPNEAYL